MSSRTTHGSRPFRSTNRRRSRPAIDRLETRALLSTTIVHPTFDLHPMAGGGGVAGYTPAQIATAYGFSSISFNGTPGTGKGETIAIVDAYDDPNIQSDLNTFDTEFGLPATTVTRVNETGGTSYPASDSTGGWELEESLDVEWAHAMAPGASIMLVEASSTSDTDLLTAVSYAAAHANVVSMSWGGSEFSGETAYDSAYFDHAGVAFVASAGDSGAPASFPSSSPNVVSVGGTALTLGSNNAWSSETGWSDSGGGPSAYESQPSYQTGVVTQTSTARATPDVAYDASPSTGVAVYDSVPYEGTTYGWLEIGGTSVGAPNWSALLAIADQGRAVTGQPALDSTNPQEVMDILYKNTGDFHDITTGTSDGSPHYSAGPGYDYVTGLGSPMANLVVASLAGTSTTANVDKLILSAPAAATAGAPISVTVTAEKSTGGTDTGYLGTIHFSSSDVQAGLPANFTFTAGDDGTYTFPVTLKTAGSQSITATDTTTSAINGTVSGIVVSPAPASQFVLSGLSTSQTAGVAATLTVTAEDPYGNVATTYSGTVKFTSSDPAALLPANTAFSTANHGVQSFPITFETPGTQSVTVTDLTSGFSTTESGITVAPAAPLNLVATAASASQINLSWTGSSGATGYLIQQSLNGSSSWTQVGSTSGGTTTFQDTGLAAGTTYYFRVIATVGSIDSGYSNVANATTTGTAATPDNIWGTGYPPENAYSYGSYEVGVKFTSSIAGTVTGVRFYKQTWMGGYLHVGHLWSSSGTLLATATFTSETSYGWQQVNFASPVAIQANTVYIVSFSTGGGYFGITTGYFNSGGYTNGPLEALSNSVSGGDGVYNRAGLFPDVDSNGMNFWTDVTFTPTSAPAGSPKLPAPTPMATVIGGQGMGALTTTAQSGRPVAMAPVQYAAAARATPVVVFGALPSRRTVTQAATLAAFVKNSLLGND